MPNGTTLIFISRGDGEYDCECSNCGHQSFIALEKGETWPPVRIELKACENCEDEFSAITEGFEGPNGEIYALQDAKKMFLHGTIGCTMKDRVTLETLEKLDAALTDKEAARAVVSEIKSWRKDMTMAERELEAVLALLDGISIERAEAAGFHITAEEKERYAARRVGRTTIRLLEIPESRHCALSNATIK